MAGTLSAYVWINYAHKTSGDMSGPVSSLDEKMKEYTDTAVA